MEMLTQGDELRSGGSGCGSSSRPNGSSNRHISKDAVSLAFIRRFISDHHIRERGLSTNDVCHQVIKPATAARQCRYTDLMLDDPEQRGSVSQGRAYYFISHAWKCKFAETMDMVARHFEPQLQRTWRRQDGRPLPLLEPEEVFVWLDTFAVNQHEDFSADGSDLKAVWEAVVEADETLMVLDSAGSPLTRIWCVYEAWHCTKARPGRLQLLSYGIPREALEQVFLGFHADKATATCQVDLASIRAAIYKDVGSLTLMTHRLKQALVANAVAQVPPEEDDWDKDVEASLETAAWFANLYGQYQEAEVLCRRQLRYQKQKLGPNHDSTWSTERNLTALLVRQGRFKEAEPMYRRALEDLEARMGCDHPNTLAWASDLADLLNQMGRYKEAEPLYVRVLEGREKMLGTGHLDTMKTAGSLASLLGSVGAVERAEPLHRRALEGLTEVLGPEHPDTLSAVNQLAVFSQSVKRTEAASRLYWCALEGRERVLGPEHPDTLSTAANLATMLLAQGKVNEANRLIQRALAGCERALGPDHTSTLRNIGVLAGLLQLQNKYEEAETLYRRALQGYERLLGANSPDTLVQVHNLAKLLEDQGRWEEATDLYKRATLGRGQVLGEEHPETTESSKALAAAFHARGKYEEAEPFYRHALARRGKYGPEHDETKRCGLLLADVLAAQGKHDEAEPLYGQYRKETSLFEHGDDHMVVPILAPIYDKRPKISVPKAVLRSQHGRYDEVDPFQRWELAEREQELGPDHPDTLNSVSILAGLLDSRGMYDEAEALFRRALEGRERALGADHPDTLSSVNDLALCLHNQEKLKDAEILYERALQGRERVLGKDHPQTKLTDAQYRQVKKELMKFDANDVFGFLNDIQKLIDTHQTKPAGISLAER